MKLASYKSGRDGRLMFVSRDLARATPCEAVPNMQAALDAWETLHVQLLAAYETFDASAEGAAFDASLCASPLPRAYQWADGSAYVNHVELVRKARGAVLPESFWTDPLMYQGGSDGFLGPRDDIIFLDTAHGLDMEAEIAVVTSDVPMAVDNKRAAEAIRLIMLVNDVSLRGLVPGELGKGFGFFNSKPASAFSPVAVTPDELGTSWRDGKLHRVIQIDLNGVPLGRAQAGEDMNFDFPTLIAHAARTRTLCAGSIIGSGTVSNRDADGGPGKPVAEGGRGYSCLAEIRMIETIREGAPQTAFMMDGDVVRIDMCDDDGQSIFGTIEQTARLR